MKNVTITLEDDVAKWARVLAAENNTSVSKLLGNVLKKEMTQEEGYKLAMQQYLSTPPAPLKESADSYPDRDSLYTHHD